jgi:glycosyltransferase involved in cell wall biosynthesis
VKTLDVLHLSTSNSGGAGLAARRLNAGLNSDGVSSAFVSLPGKSQAMQPNEIKVDRSFINLLKSAALSRFQKEFSDKTFFSPLSLNVFEIEHLIARLDPSKTIIHIHNWYNFLNLRSIGKLADLGFNLAFTLHDQRLMTGGCHYSLNCDLFKNGCEKCPEVSFLLSGLPGIVHAREFKYLEALRQRSVLIAPSKWMCQKAMESHHLRHFEIESIPNFITPDSSEMPKQSLKNTDSKITLGIASENPYAYIKGGEIIRSLENDADFHSRYRLVFMRSYPDIRDFWETIDVLFVPSICDNSPNVILEAKIRSLPIIAASVGGIAELLFSGLDMSIDLGNLTAPYLVGRFDEIKANMSNSDARLRSKLKFDESNSTVLQRHINLYSSLRNRNSMNKLS